MKKILALLLALVMVCSLAACGGTSGATNPADDIPDEMTSEDGKYQVAFITDVGSLKDKSFNQGTYDGVKLYAANNGKSYKYYQPANSNEATDEDRIAAFDLACTNGAVSSMAGQNIGAGEFARAKKTMTTGMGIAFAISVVVFATAYC